MKHIEALENILFLPKWYLKRLAIPYPSWLNNNQNLDKVCLFFWWLHFIFSLVQKILMIIC